MTAVDVVDNVRRICPLAAIIIALIVRVIMMVVMMVISVIVRIPVVMVAIIVMPVIGAPGMPVVRIITPVPGRMPCHVGGQEHETDQWPGCDLDGRNPIYHNRLSVHYSCSACISRIGRLTGIPAVRIVIGFNDIVLSIQGLISDQLDPDLITGITLHNEDSNVLVLADIDGYLQDDDMHILVGLVNDPYIVDIIVSVQIKVVDPIVLIIQGSFETFEGFGFLKKLHYGIKVQVITR
jgi:hypothetical protein